MIGALCVLALNRHVMKSALTYKRMTRFFFSPMQRTVSVGEKKHLSLNLLRQSPLPHHHRVIDCHAHAHTRAHMVTTPCRALLRPAAGVPGEAVGEEPQDPRTVQRLSL